MDKAKFVFEKLALSETAIINAMNSATVKKNLYKILGKVTKPISKSTSKLYKGKSSKKFLQESVFATDIAKRRNYLLP